MSKYNYKYLQELLQKYECKFFENQNYGEITLKREVKINFDAISTGFLKIMKDKYPCFII
jgi:hypothetical protein